jgi:hypothetical protein
MKKLPIQSRVDRDTLFRFKNLAHSHGVSIERALEELMRGALERAGVATTDNQTATTEVQAR